MTAFRPEALLFLPLIIIGGMCLLGTLAWIYEKTRRKIEYPGLGTLTFTGESWTGLMAYPLREKAAVRFELPGSKIGPNSIDVDRFLQFWPDVSQHLDIVRPHATVELEDCFDSVSGTRDEEPFKEILERTAADPTAFDKEWSLCQVGLYEGTTQERYWTLDFDVTWDAEHTRCAYLDLDGGFLGYNLSCAVVEY